MSVMLNPTIERKSDPKRALLAERLRKAAEAAVPLSFAQQRLWFLDQLEPNSPSYNVPIVVNMRGTLDVDALRRALEMLIARHETLRTRFVDNDGSPAQVVDAKLRGELNLHDLTERPVPQREGEARALMREEVNRPFDLRSGPPIRAMLIRTKADEHWFVLNLHHIISDEWSLKICIEELTEFYTAFCDKRDPQFPPLPIQYADYTLWQREWLRDEVVEQELGYWRERLQGNPPVLELPADHPRPAMQTFRGGIQTRVVPAGLSESLMQLGTRHGATLFMVTLAAFKALLYRYTQQDDVVIGSPITGRNRMETERLIGFFVNTLLLRTDLSGDPPFEELLRRVRETTLNAYAHGDLPFEKLVEKLHPERAATHMPFTRLMFALQNGLMEELRWPGVVLRFSDPETETSKFDLTLVVQVSERGLVLQAEYNRDLFEPATVERMLEHFEILLNGIVEDPRRRLSELPLLSETELRQVIVDWNNNKTDYAREKCIHELFEAQAERTPNATAVVFGRQSLTYEELNHRANRLAHYLKKFSVGPDVLVGICVERSVEMVVGMLAILKAGGAYMPIESGYPRERLTFMLADAGAPVLLTQQPLVARLPKSANVLCLDSDWELVARESRKNLTCTTTPDNLAYVIYTSGSTGTPKGVAVPHRAVNRLVLNTNYIQFNAGDRVAQTSNASFDAATFEVWGALLTGGTLVGITRDVSLSPADFARELRERKISAMFLTTALFNQLAAEVPDAFATVRTVMFGGEFADPKSIARVLQNKPPRHLFNVYGPTENTTFSTYHDLQAIADDATNVPIGRPISNSQCYILDAHLKPMPIGVPGELHVSGDGLARGYWNRQQLTVEKFIHNPFQSGELMYKTGDLARWLPDGNIEFLGRLDEQVKIRGFRVELGEIEAILARHPAVRECVVSMRKDETGLDRLVAYFVSGARVPSFDELLRFLKDKLPDYMIPATFVPLRTVPLTPNGKVDRKALPEPDKSRPLVERVATPRDAVELKLTQIWENVLDVHPIGIEDKFFDLGGHSLLAVKVIAQIEKVFGRRLRVATVFQAPTIEQLAAIIREEIQEGSALAGTSLVEIQSQGSRPPLFLVHGAGGGMFWGYVNLSRHLGADQPVYGLKSRGLDGREELGSIEEMAAHYVADIRRLQPHGPYHLGGYCFGGTVAMEMARQINAQGEEVALLALLNCSPPNSDYDRISWTPAWGLRFGRNLLYWVDYFRHWMPAQRREFFRWKKEILKQRIARLLGRDSNPPLKIDADNLVDLSSFPTDQRKLWRIHIDSLLKYHPQRYTGRVHLFRSPGHPLICSFEPDYGWGGLAAGGVDISIVPGVHEKILEEPCVRSLAKELKNRLDEVSPTEPMDILRAPQIRKEPEPEVTAAAGSIAVGERVDFPLSRVYTGHFEEQAAKTPNLVAIRHKKQNLTYAELNARANRLARHLQTLGVGPEIIVAVCLERSAELIVALLAILKAGGAFLVLDRTCPKERLASVLADSRAGLLLTRTELVQNPGIDGLTLICLDDLERANAIEAADSGNLPNAGTPDNLAYVMYSSEVSHRPTGVEITQRSLLNHNFAILRAYNLSAEDRVLQFSSFNGDSYIEEIFPSLLRGCAVVLCDDDVISSTARFVEFVGREQLTVMNLPAAYWHELVDYLQTALMPPSVRLVIVAGKASDEAWRRWKFRIGETVKLVNTYGRTEATITAIMHSARLTDESVPIGRPLANVKIMVLDADRRPVAVGETGELYIGGPSVARGYLNQPELTAEKFFPNALSGETSQTQPRFYKTGDLARMRRDGLIEFLGRIDEAVKIDGSLNKSEENPSADLAHCAPDSTSARSGGQERRGEGVPRAQAEISLDIRSSTLDVRCCRDHEEVEAQHITGVSMESQPVLPVEPAARGEGQARTRAQWRMWHLDQFEAGQPEHNIPTLLRLKGPLNLKALQESFTELYRRHEALRTMFPSEDGQSIEIICEPREIPLLVIDFAHLPEQEREKEALAAAIKESAKPYVMSRPMLRPRLMRLSEQEHLLLIVTHGVACDTASVGILMQELVTLYESFARENSKDDKRHDPEYLEGEAVSDPLGETPRLYGKQEADRGTEALESLELPAEVEKQQLEYWTERLKDAPVLLELPADRSRPARRSNAGARCPLVLSKEISDAIETLAHKEECPPFVVLLAAFQMLLSRYTGATDIVVGSNFGIRNGDSRSLEGVIGKFDNLIALRCDLSGDPEFREFLPRVRETTKSALANDKLLFERILAALLPERNESHAPIFQVMFNFDDKPLEKMQAARLSFVPAEIHNQTCKVDLELHLSQSPQGLSGWIEYSTALFDRDRIARMAEHFAILLKAVSRNPAERLSTLPLMPEHEWRKVLLEWNGTEKEYPSDATLVRLFEAQVKRTPAAIALVDGAERLSYIELNARSNQIAHRLRSLKVTPGKLVGICARRSWRLVAGILGVLKAGGAYVPLDPAYPVDRLAFILDDAKAPVLLTEQTLRSLQVPEQTEVICLDTDWPYIQQQSRENPVGGAGSGDLAYVIYTSGSTGKPKGVALEHRNTAALIYWARDVFSNEELAGVLASTSICFDLSVFEMFVPLSWGGTVILAENALALPGLPAVGEVTLINTVPSAMRELLRVKGVPKGVRIINLAGEPLITPLVNEIYAETNVQKVYDLYGPSETTTYSTFTLRKPDEPATIGRPLTNEQVYLLDRNFQPVPIGMPGEIYIGGDGVARGYLNRPELTAEKFVSNPLKGQLMSHVKRGRFYKTGDLARWRNDGNLEFLGRIDHQVKIRGFRIELGEIESVLRKHPQLGETVVVVREDRPGDKRLVAYVVPKTGSKINTDELRRFTREALPEYMVPSAFVILGALPMTPNGKVDRKALPAPKQDRESISAGFAEPVSLREEELAAIWREVLGVERIGTNDNFFELGGHSLLAIQVISRVREKFKVELPLFGLFEAPTIRQLAEGLSSGEWATSQVSSLPMQHVPRDGHLPLSSVQERLWFLDQVSPGGHAYNVPMALRLKGGLDVLALQRALNEVVGRHEALRTTFANDKGELIQVIAPAVKVEMDVANFESFPAPERESATQSWLNTEAQRAFELARGPLFRAKLARLGAQEHVLLVVMHHTISDGWSFAIFFQELGKFYQAFAANKPTPEVPAPAVQYADFAHWQRRCLQGSKLEQEMAFWKSKLAGAPSSVRLPADRAEAATGVAEAGKAGRFTEKFSTGNAEALAEFSRGQNATPFMVLTTALAITFEKWARQQDMVIGTVVAGRTRRELENVIGCFMNFLPIRIQLNSAETGQELLAKVKAAVLEAQAHQDCPFEKMVEAVNPERRLNQNPLYNIALLLQNFPEQLFQDKNLSVTRAPVDLEAAQLDLRFEAELNGQNLEVLCEYKTALFDQSTIQQLLASYRSAVEMLLKNPGAKISEFSITDELQTRADSSRAPKEQQKLVIASTFTAEPVEDSLRYWMSELDSPTKIEFAPFNQVFQQLLDPASILAANTRGANVILARLDDFGDRTGSPEAIQRGAREFISAIRTASAKMTTPLFVFLCPVKPERSVAVAELEKTVVGEIEKLGGVYTVASSELLELYPVADFYDARGDELGCVPYTPLFFTALGTMIARKLHALQRAPHKVIVLDCDQTLWGGVCGEDGSRGISVDGPWRALQEFMRAQHAAGRLLAICSKNNEEDVREVFAQRLDMPLRREHFATWRLNWTAKSQNIKAIAEELNLGLDSFIFIDDNPVECAEVEANCPQVLTLQLPENPADIPQFLRHCWVFDTSKITAEDARRGEMYRQGRQREELRASTGSLAEFLAGLELKIDVVPMSPEQLPRVAQLTHRTNQFNATTVRRSEAEIQQLAGKANVLTVSVNDRFGDYGLAGVIICEPREQALDVGTFLLSCRVLGRGVEHEMLSHLGHLACEQKKSWVNVHFHPSAKNKPAFDFLESVGSQFKKGLNGGFVYAFPAEFAAEVTLDAQDAPAVPAQTNFTRKPEREDALAPVSTGSKFTRCRAIAVGLNDPQKIQLLVEENSEPLSSKQTAHVPPRTQLEKQICQLWQKLLRVERVGLKDNFFELGGHSLLAVRLFSELEKLTGQKLPLVTVFQAPTVEELARAAGGSQSGAARSILVPVQANGSRPPLFLVHGAGGDVLWGYANLAKHMHPDQPVYGIKSRGQVGLDEFEQVEDMARYYLEEIRALQPRGPYFLGGYCFGGNVAYEMARQLRAQGEQAAQVLLIDSSPSNAGYDKIPWWRPSFYYRFARNLVYWFKDFVTLLEPADQRRYFMRKIRVTGRRVFKLFHKSKTSNEVDLDEVIDISHFPESELKFWRIHLNALVAHVERPYGGAVTLLRTRGQPAWCSFEDDFSWSKLARGGVTVKHIPGSHENVFVEPNVKSLGESIEECLAASQSLTGKTPKQLLHELV